MGHCEFLVLLFDGLYFDFNWGFIIIFWLVWHSILFSSYFAIISWTIRSCSLHLTRTTKWKSIVLSLCGCNWVLIRVSTNLLNLRFTLFHIGLHNYIFSFNNLFRFFESLWNMRRNFYFILRSSKSCLRMNLGHFRVFILILLWRSPSIFFDVFSFNLGRRAMIIV